MIEMRNDDSDVMDESVFQLHNS